MNGQTFSSLLAASLGKIAKGVGMLFTVYERLLTADKAFKILSKEQLSEQRNKLLLNSQGISALACDLQLNSGKLMLEQGSVLFFFFNPIVNASLMLLRP